MKAIVQREYGAPQDVLRLADVDMPVVGVEDVLVSVRASSANPWDWHYIRGEPVLFRPALGGIRKPKFKVPGGDLAGTVKRQAAASRHSSRAMMSTASATAPSPSTSPFPTAASRSSRRA